MNSSINCPSCGKAFAPGRATVKYCSNACRQRAHRKRHPAGDRMDYRARLSMMVWDAQDSGRMQELRDALNASLAELARAAEPPPPPPKARTKAERDVSEQYWRSQIQQHHPDKGGDPEKFRFAKTQLDALRRSSRANF